MPDPTAHDPTGRFSNRAERSGLFGATRVELVAKLDALYARHADASGQVAMAYETEVRLSERLTPGA